MNKFVYKTYRDITKLALRRIMTGKGIVERTPSHVAEEHSRAWSHHPEEFFFGKVRPQMLNKRIVHCRAIDHRKYFLSYIFDSIKNYRPESILELGSGLGINILTIAALFPEIKKLRGIELTKEGVNESERYRANPPMHAIRYLTGLSLDEISTNLKDRDISFSAGDITKTLSLEEESTDFIFTTWVLEQLPRAYAEVLHESAKILKKGGVAHFMEHFKEAQQNIFQRMHLKNMDYFRASWKSMEQKNLRIVKFEPVPLNKIKFSSGSLVLQKSGEN